MVLHLAYCIPNKFNGYNTGTLCGLANKIETNGNNATDNKTKVTCKKCLKIMNDPKNWRYKKYITR